MSPLRGERLGRATYRLLERLSDDVFLAYHEIFDGKIVQKTVSMHGFEDALASSEPAFLNQLDHPRIVPVREAQWDPNEDNAITFVMPHFAGGSVHDALSEDYRFSIHQSVEITIDALDALAYVHREFGAVHRDTKPGNVLLDGQRRHSYLSDFGSAAVIDDQGEAAAILGTSIYWPPESKRTGRVGVDADLYGIGMMLFEMLCGRLRWEELDWASVERRLQRGLRPIPDSALQFQPHVPESLRRCVRRAIERDPARRYRSAEAFIRALRKVSGIDWRHYEGDTLEGVWVGTWPPRLRPERRTDYRVASRLLKAGRGRGRIRVESEYRKPGFSAWRQAVADATVEVGDIPALSEYFRQVEASAAHRSPAR